MRTGLLLLAMALASCSGSSHDEPPRTRTHASAHAPAPPPPPPAGDVAPLPGSTFPAPARLVAIGDVHGDLEGLESALRAAGAVDADAHWTGGELVVVQTGDLLDRGDQEREILDFVELLTAEAQRAGGRVLALNGNHEFMNAQGDFRYVTPGGYTDFASYAQGATGPLYEGIPVRLRGRVAAFRPGGPYARVFATHATIVMVGDTLFVHGGALARHLTAGLDAINEGARRFFLGEGPLPPQLEAEDGPIWYRGYALSDDEDTCAELGRALAVVHARRMVIGHTKQENGITTACDGRVVRIDVGLARIYGGPIQAFEIVGDQTRVITGER